MDDVISRYAAIDALTEDKKMINAVLDSLTLDYNARRNQEQRRGQINEDIETIKALPSARPEQRWIPCSERLPEIGKEVLLSEPNVMFIAEYHGSGDPEGLWLVDGRHHYLADVNRCAWQLLSKPYRGEEDEASN